MNEKDHPFTFSNVAREASNRLGTPYAFAAACGLVILWAVTGPLFGYSDTWQLVINTATTIVTFLMVFLVQSTQNRDARALHLKLDEILRIRSDRRTVAKPTGIVSFERVHHDGQDGLVGPSTTGYSLI